ncbi:MAG: sialidase family protein [bacterium]
MRYRSIFVPLSFVLFFALLVSGCSRSRTPTVPENKTLNDTAKISRASLGLSGESVFGKFDIVIQPEIPDAIITPIRRSADIGESWDLEIDQYLQSDPCTDCLHIGNLGLDELNRIVMDVGIKHPFDKSSSRLDLDAFDVRAIIVVQGNEIFPNTLIGDQVVFGQFKLLANADGFTNHCDDGPGGGYPGNLNPYIDFFTEDDPSWDGTGEEIENHRMAVGADFDYKRLVFDIPFGGNFPFRLVVGASYGQSAKKIIPEGEPGSRSNPQYYIPEFNRKEAYSVAMNTDELNFGATPTMVVDLEILDWQAGARVASSYLENLDEISTSSDIASLSLEIPEIEYFSSEPDSITGLGVHGDPVHARFSVPLTTFSLYSCLARVTDERDVLVEEMDISTYQYTKVDNFIKMGANIPIAPIEIPYHDIVLGRRSIAVDQNYVYVVWTDIDSMKGVVLCSSSSDGGETFGLPVTVNDSSHQDGKQKPSVTTDSLGNVYIVWEDYGNLNPFSDASDILMSISHDHGMSFNDDVRVNDTELVDDDNQFEPGVCVGANNILFVCWMEKPSAESFKQIRVARSTNMGVTFTEKAVSSQQLRTGNPTMDANENGIVWVAWRDYRRDHQDIYACKSTNNGLAYGQEIRVNDDETAEYQSAPSLAVGSDGTAYIAWEDSRKPGNHDFNIYFAYSIGNTSFSENQKINRIDDVAINPKLAITPEGGVFVVYRDMRNEAVGDIYVTGSLDKGKTFSVHHDVMVNDDLNGGIQLSSQIAVGSDGKLHVTWCDGRDGNPRIFYAGSLFP